VVTGGCHCGNLRLTLELTDASESFHPRACDCDFCRKHGAAYVSDPAGSLLIRIRSEQLTGRYTQGSGTAQMLICRNCGVLVGALYQGAGRLYAVANASAVDTATRFGTVESVSPKSLSAAEKVQRWQGLWFADVRVVANTP
jgi:hypothetical protein